MFARIWLCCFFACSIVRAMFPFVSFCIQLGSMYLFLHCRQYWCADRAARRDCETVVFTIACVWMHNSLCGKLACLLRSELIMMVLLTLVCGIAWLMRAPVPQYGTKEGLEALRRARLQEHKDDVQLAMLGGGWLFVFANPNCLFSPYLHFALFNNPGCQDR